MRMQRSPARRLLNYHLHSFYLSSLCNFLSMRFTDKSPVSLQNSVNSFRRYTRGCYLALLTLLSLFILASILHQRQNYLLCISLSLQSNIKPSRSIVIHPGDIISRSSLEVRPQDDQAPFAHEPVGTGTLRDVRYVFQLVLFHISPTYYHMSFINIFLTSYPNSLSIGKRNSIVGGH